MPTTLPTELLPLAALVFLLGMKHGFDADHLATIDGLTRFNQLRHPRLAARCGVLFSLGHGAVVMLIALLVSTVAQQWQTPQWLDALGLTISVSFLVLLGVANLWRAWHTQPDVMYQPLGWRSTLLGRLFGRLMQTSHPVLIAAVGALFALSFDTMSQAALFAATAHRLGGLLHALLLGALFTLGMLLTDGLNGWWMTRLLQRADGWAHRAGRLMGGVIGLLSLLLACYTVAAHQHAGLEAAMAGQAYWMSVILMTTLLLGFAMVKWRYAKRTTTLLSQG